MVTMFKWYQGAALMVVFLRGVSSSSPVGALARSIWHTRGWTLQEYIVAKKVHFYTENWTPLSGSAVNEPHRITGSDCRDGTSHGGVATSLTGADQAGTQTAITTDLEPKLVPILGDIDIGVAVESTATPIQSSEVPLKFEIQTHDNRSRNLASRPGHIAVSMPR